MSRTFGLLILICSLCLSVSAQAPSEPIALVPGQHVEREIAGGESHVYQITLTAGQFARFRLEQRAIDSALILTAPDGKQLAEMNLTGMGEQESLSLEAAASNYRLTVRGNGTATLHGSYRLDTTVQATATAQDRKRLAAEALLIEANELAKQAAKTAEQVIEKLELALSIWRELGEPSRVAWSLFKIGTAHVNLSRPEKAIEYYEQALATYRELKDRFGEGKALTNLANMYYNMRQFEKAIEYFEKTLTLYREVKYRLWEGLILYSIGNTYNRLNQPEKAIERYEQALTILREVKDGIFEGQALLNLGGVYLNQGRPEKALEVFEQARAVFREVKAQSLEGQALNNVGIANDRLGRSEKAIEYFKQALALFQEVKDRTNEANILISIGTAYGSQGRTEKAIEYFEQGLAIGRELKDKQRESHALNNLGLAYSFLSQYEKSIKYLEQALLINRETKNRLQEGYTFSNLGTSYTGLGRSEKAIECHEQALAIFQEVKFRLGVGNTLQKLGAVYISLGRDEKAIEYFEQALTIFREVKYRVGEGNALANLGGSYDRLGRFEEAIARHEQALAIHRELKYRLGEGSSLMELGVGRARLNQHEKALELYQQALAILREVKSREFEGLTLFRMGESKQQLGRTDEAAALFTESVAILREIGNRNLEFGALTALAKTEGERGNLAQARTLIEKSLQISESLRADLVSPESRTAFLAAVQDSYQLYTDLLMRQHRNEPAKGLDALAVEVSERRRARSLLDLLAEASADLRQGVDPALIESERALAKQLNDKAQTQANTPEQTVALKQEISQLENDYERAQAAIRKSSPHYAALTQPQPLKLAQIQQQLDAETLLLEYSLGTERSYLWAITKDALTSYELPKQEQLNQNALAVYEMLTARGSNKRGETSLQRSERIAQAETKLPAASQELSQTLLGPVAAQLGNKRLVIVADGALQYIPFAMLPEPVPERQKDREKERKDAAHSVPPSLPRSVSPQPLIVNHEVISLPSASALAVQRTELAGRQPAPKMLAVIADPVFDRTDERFKTMAAEDNAQPPTLALADERSIEHLAEKSGGKSGETKRKLIIPRLPYTRQEADQLLALTPKTSSFRAIDFQASRATVLNPELSQYRYVHFATHGLLDSERPGLSSLVLSMVDEQGKAQDGFLRANDIYNLKLPAELVVLSACQTGLGKEIKGEGLIGLTRGFMYAGAARVVVSLWSVNDQATADLMTRFYQKMLKRGERPAAALRAAQVEMWRQKQWQAPFYWAAFTLQGEWK